MKHVQSQAIALGPRRNGNVWCSHGCQRGTRAACGMALSSNSLVIRQERLSERQGQECARYETEAIQQRHGPVATETSTAPCHQKPVRYPKQLHNRLRRQLHLKDKVQCTRRCLLTTSMRTINSPKCPTEILATIAKQAVLCCIDDVVHSDGQVCASISEASSSFHIRQICRTTCLIWQRITPSSLFSARQSDCAL